MKLAEIIKDFSPSYGACIMGTGILAITSKIYSSYFSPLGLLAVFFTLLNTLLAVIVSTLWFARWILYPKNAVKDLNHPVKTNFYPTLPIGYMILGMDYMSIIGWKTLGEILWFIGAIMTFVFALIIPYNLFKSESMHISHINPSIFIPPVGLIVIPIGGGIIAGQYTGMVHELLLLLNTVSWGAGFFIYLALLAVCVYRFLLHEPLPSTLAPTMWINLGPIGAGTVALNNIIMYSGLFKDAMVPALKAFMTLFWGSGVWWLLLAVMMTIHYILVKGLPYAPSWWAFTFPLGAYVAATHVVHGITGLAIIDYTGLVLYLLLLFLWTAAFQGIIRRTLTTLIGAD